MDVFFRQYFDFDIISENFSFVLEGFGQTLLLSVVSAVLAMSFGMVLALLRQSPGRPMLAVRGLAIAYIDVMRGIPLLLVILLMSGSIPFLTFLPDKLRYPDFFGKPDIFWFGVFSIALTYAAYYAEVYRSGLEGVPYGQTEAARSLGMSHFQSLRFVIVPQAIRRVIPPMLNDFIALMKDTSLVQVIGYVEVVRAGREVQAETFNSSALTLGAVMFVVVTIPLARIVDRLIAKQQSQTRRTAA